VDIVSAKSDRSVTDIRGVNQFSSANSDYRRESRLDAAALFTRLDGAAEFQEAWDSLSSSQKSRFKSYVLSSIRVSPHSAHFDYDVIPYEAINRGRGTGLPFSVSVAKTGQWVPDRQVRFVRLNSDGSITPFQPNIIGQ
jgi:hypothetical protein